MKLNDIPAPVWYIGAAALAVVVVGVIVKKGAGKAAQAINPFNPNNSINAGFNHALESVGVIDKGSSLGSQIYDWLHPNSGPQAVTPYKPKPKPVYDYGQGGDSGVPYRAGANSQPDPFNLATYDWRQPNR